MMKLLLHILFIWLFTLPVLSQSSDEDLDDIMERLEAIIEASDDAVEEVDEYESDYNEVYESDNNNEAQEEYLKTPIEKKRFNRDKWNDIRRRTIEEAMGEGGYYESGESPYGGREYTRKDNPYEQSQKNYERYWEERKKNAQEIKRRPKERAPRNRNIDRAVSDKMGDMSMSPAVSYILIGLIVAVLAGLIFYLFFKAPPANNKVIPKDIDDNVNPTEIPKSELELALEEALDKGDYRRAIRIYFIFIIRGLSEKKWINWEKEKTNFTYLNEMRKNEHYNAFDETVMLYEIVWYGKRKVDKTVYQKLEPTFKSLVQKIEN